jgi:hypothetical protein
MLKADKRTKICATCSMWGGNREFDIRVSLVGYEPSDKGKCFCRGAYWNINMKSMLTCDKWDCWGPLK